MNASKFYGTRSKKALDKIKELEKAVVEFIADRDRWISRYELERRNGNDLQLKVDAMKTAIDGQKELADNLLIKNKELVAQIRELEKLEIDAPVDLVPTIKATSEELGVHLLPAGNYTIELVDGRMKIIGVAK